MKIYDNAKTKFYKFNLKHGLVFIPLKKRYTQISAKKINSTVTKV